MRCAFLAVFFWRGSAERLSREGRDRERRERERKRGERFSIEIRETRETRR